MDLSSWWSTNFLDAADSTCSITPYSGGYYSKRTVATSSSSILMGICTVDANNVNLYWGTTWGLAVANSVFDDGTNPITVSIPVDANGVVYVDALNQLIMNKVPTRGAYVMINLTTGLVYFAALDGESFMVPNTTTTTVLANPASDNVLPLTSNLTGLPTFTNVDAAPTTSGYSGVGFSTPSSMNTMDYSRKWLPIPLQGYIDTVGSFNGTYQSLAAAQAVTPTCSSIIWDGTTNWYAFNSISVIKPITPASSRQWYSGWLRPGTATQMVGWIYASTSSTGLTYFCTPYGFTSVAPLAQSGETGQSGSTYQLKSSNVQAELFNHMKLASAGQGVVGYVYDASVGQYGQVAWIGQV